MISSELFISTATLDDVPALAGLRKAVALEQTRRFGLGHWSSVGSEKGAQQNLQHALVLIARIDAQLVGSLRLAVRRPWAIDPAYFTAVTRPLYLSDMSVNPSHQGLGIGRLLMDAGREAARESRAGAIRLDAYDHLAGAGPFYQKCGFREMGRVSYRGVPLIYFEEVLATIP